MTGRPDQAEPAAAPQNGWTQCRTADLAAAAVAVALLSFLALAWFVVPQADDYCYSVLARERGVLETALQAYRGWSGRFAAVVVLTLPYELSAMTGISLTGAYRFASFCQVLVTLGVLALIARKIWPGAVGMQRFAVAALFSFAVIANLRSPLGFFYWVTGSLVHGLPALFSAYLTAHLYAAATGTTRIGPLTTAALAGLSLISANFSEPIGGCIIAMALSLFIAARGERRGLGVPVLAVILGAVVGTVVTVLAPGNAYRIAANEGGSLVPALVTGPVHFLNYLALRVDAYGFLAWLVLAGILSAPEPEAASIPRSHHSTGLLARNRIAVAVLAGWLLSCLYSFTVGAYAIGSLLPARAQNIVHLLGAVSLTIAVVEVSRRDGVWISAWLRSQVPAWLRQRALPICAVVMLLSLKWVFAVIDLLGPAQSFAQEHRAREAKLIAASGGDAEIAPYSSRPHHLFFADLTDGRDPQESWVNECMADYYGLESVRAVPGAKTAAGPSPDAPPPASSWRCLARLRETKKGVHSSLKRT